jgi:pyruvate kinase
VNVKDEIKNKGTKIQNIDILTTTGCTIAFEESENVDMFVCLTDTGKVARFLAKHHPKQPILACSTSG